MKAKKFVTVTQILTLIGSFFVTATVLLANHPVAIPRGTVVELRMNKALSSDTAREGDIFTATVLRSLQIEGEMAVPEGSTVHGKVTMAQPAQRGSKAGAIGVEFFRLTLPEGKSYNIVGDLTSLRAEERKQILEEEGRIKGESSRKRNVIFIGGGAGAGAVIGAIAGGGKGAGIGAAAGAGLGALGALLSSGEEARVPEGTEIAMEFLRQVTVSPATQYHTGANDRTLYTSQALGA